MSTQQRLVNGEVRALMGARGPVRSSPDEVSTSEIRRFAQAAFDDNRLFYDDETARKSRFGGRVAPGMFAINSLRPNIPFVDDSLRRANAVDEMYRFAVTEGLPRPHQWEGLYHFHANDDVEFYRLPHVGDRLTAHPYLKDIYEKTGRNGALAFYVVRTDWKNQRNETVASHDRIAERHRLRAVDALLPLITSQDGVVVVPGKTSIAVPYMGVRFPIVPKNSPTRFT